MPGSWNGFTNSNDADAMGSFRMIKRPFAGGQYKTTLNIQATDGDTSAGTYQMLFTSGPESNQYANKWVDATLTAGELIEVTYQGNNDNEITVENGFHYTFLFNDNGYESTSTIVFKTERTPVTIEDVNGLPATPVEAGDSVQVSVMLSAVPSPEERIFLRYSTDEFSSSDVVEVTNFDGTASGSVYLPSQPFNSVVQFYALSTTVAPENWNNNIDLLTLQFNNNEDGNYTYSYETEVVIAPLNGSTEISLTPNFRWSAVDSAETYAFQIATENTFSEPILDQSALSDTSYTISEAEKLAPNTKHFWRFRADNQESWSSIYTFTTRTGIAYANLQFPSSAAVDSGMTTTIYGQVYVPTITGEADSSADISVWTGVNVENTDPSTWDESKWKPAFFNEDKNPNDEYSAEIGDSLSPGEYFYAFRYQYQDKDLVYGGDQGFWNAENNPNGNLVVQEVPELISPADDATDVIVAPHLRWETSSTHQAGFQIQIATDADFNQLIVDRNNISAESQTFSVPENALRYEQAYSWRIRTLYENSSSSWSEVFSFTTLKSAPSAPEITNPENGETDVPIPTVLSWSEAEGAIDYELELSLSSDFEPVVIHETNIIALSYTNDTLETGQLYFWRVRAQNETGNSAWSSPFSFTTIPDAPSQPEIQSPQNGNTAEFNDEFLTLNWNSVSGAASYQVQLSLNDEFSTTLIDTSEVTTDTLAVEGLDDETTYFWRVKAMNSGGESDWSAVAEFITPTDVSLEDDAVIPDYALNQNYPNPFNPATTVSFQLPAEHHVTISVYDLTGRLVSTLADRRYSSGKHSVTFNAEQLSSGIYIVRMRTENFTQSIKMTLLK